MVEYLIVISTTLIILFTIVSIYWTVVLARKIHLSMKYMKGVVRNISNEESKYMCEQYYYHYQTEIRKSILLLMINFVEFFGAASYYLELVLQDYKYDPESVANSSVKIYIEGCANVNNSLLTQNQLEVSAIPLLTTSKAFGNVADIFVVALGICLMSFLLKRMKRECYFPININIKKFMVVLSIISFVVILTSYFTFFILLSKILFVPVLIIDLIVFISFIKKFKQALLQIALERLIQHRSNDIEMKQYRYFSYTMFCICLGFSLITIASTILNIQRFILIAVFYGQCYFPFNLIFSSKISLPFTKQGMNTVAQINNYCTITHHVIGFVGVAAFIFPYIFITVTTWINFLYKKFTRKSVVQFRYKVYSNIQDSTLSEFLLDQ